MARAGLAEPQARVVREAVQDTATVIRFQRKVRTLPGQDCWWWTGAISGRGHGRFWLGRVEGRDVVAIAHRFAWALTYGAESLMAVPVLGHRCDNPLCQRIGPGHVEASSAGRNRREWAMRRHTVGAVLRDSRGARGRAQELRDCLRADPTGLSLPGAASTGLRWDSAQLPLWADAGGRASAFGARAGWPQWWVGGEHPSGAAGPRQDRGEQTRTPLLEVSPVDGPATVHRPATRGSQASRATPRHAADLLTLVHAHVPDLEEDSS